LLLDPSHRTPDLRLYERPETSHLSLITARACIVVDGQPH
jgi:hypothetical protein